MNDPLSLERLLSAQETLTHIIMEMHRTGPEDRFPGAVGAEQAADGCGVWGLLVEVRRNLNAFAQWKHGEAGLDAMLDQEAWGTNPHD